MLYQLKRHPLPVEARFEHCLVLAYALPESALQPFLPPALTLDTYNHLAFLAAAFVQTRSLRPAFLPRCLGQDFFLAGYRIFVKHRTPEGRTLRGLRILRSDTDKRSMVWGGNLLTHYNYRLCRSKVIATPSSLSIRTSTKLAAADVDVTAFLDDRGLPPESPFPDEHTARRFQGPLPYTFDYEPETRSIIRIKGIREHWNPVLVRVDVRQLGFLSRFAAHRPILASAFHIADIPYRWDRGVLEPGVAA
jgi:hypothetical protein